MRSHTSQYDKVPGHLSLSLSKSGPVHFGPKNWSLSNYSHESVLVLIIWDHLGFPKYWNVNFSPAEIASAFKGLFLTVPTIINGTNCSARLFTKFFSGNIFCFAYLDRSFMRTNTVRFSFSTVFDTENSFYVWHLFCLCFHDRLHATFNLASALKSNLFPMIFLFRLAKIG